MKLNDGCSSASQFGFNAFSTVSNSYTSVYVDCFETRSGFTFYNSSTCTGGSLRVGPFGCIEGITNTVNVEVSFICENLVVPPPLVGGGFNPNCMYFRLSKKTMRN